MTEPEYRQDDTDDGYCPACGQPLTALTVGARGYCDTHGWQWAEWRTGNRDPGDETDEEDAPMTAQHWTDETDREADEYFATLPDREIRRRQDLCHAQQRAAYDQGNDRALADLQRMEDALARTMMARLLRSNGGLDTRI